MNFLASLSSDCLFSTIAAVYTLLLLYSPCPLFTRFLFSPVVLPTLILLLYLLRLGASKDSQPSDSAQGSELTTGSDLDLGPGPFCDGFFCEWDVRAPLEVIYEEFEEDCDGDGSREESATKAASEIQRYASLSLFYPESDGDGSSEDYGGEEACFRLQKEEEDDDWEGLIEIALGGDDVFEEDNLIDIDVAGA